MTTSLSPAAPKMRWTITSSMAFRASSTVWQTMAPEARRTLAREAERVGDELRARRESTDRGAIEAMIARGLNVHSPTPAQWEQWQRFAKAIHPKVRGTQVPEGIFDRVQSLLSEYRSIGR